MGRHTNILIEFSELEYSLSVFLNLITLHIYQTDPKFHFQKSFL